MAVISTPSRISRVDLRFRRPLQNIFSNEKEDYPKQQTSLDKEDDPPNMGQGHRHFHRRQVVAPTVTVVSVEVIATVDPLGNLIGKETSTIQDILPSPTPAPAAADASPSVATVQAQAASILPEVAPVSAIQSIVTIAAQAAQAAPSLIAPVGQILSSVVAPVLPAAAASLPVVPQLPSVAPVSLPSVPSVPAFPSNLVVPSVVAFPHPSSLEAQAEAMPTTTSTPSPAPTSAPVSSALSIPASTKATTDSIATPILSQTTALPLNSLLSSSSSSPSTSLSDSSSATESFSSESTASESIAATATATNTHGANGKPGNPGIAPAATTAAGASNPSGSPAPLQTPQVVGSVVGSLAGAALILAIILLLLRRHKRRRRGALQLTGDDHTDRDQQPMTQEPARASLVPATFLNRFSSMSRSTADTSTSAGERSFQRVSGRKLPSAFSEGMTSDQFSRGGTLSGSSFYQDDHGTYGDASFAKEIGSDFDKEIGGSSNFRGSGPMNFRPSPARTPIIRHPDDTPVFGMNRSHLSPPQSPNSDFAGRPSLGRSLHSADGSRASRFSENV